MRTPDRHDGPKQRVGALLGLLALLALLTFCLATPFNTMAGPGAARVESQDQDAAAREALEDTLKDQETDTSAAQSNEEDAKQPDAEGKGKGGGNSSQMLQYDSLDRLTEIQWPRDREHPQPPAKDPSTTSEDEAAPTQPATDDRAEKDAEQSTKSGAVDEDADAW